MLITHYWGSEVSIRALGLANVILKNIGYSILGEELCLKVKSYKLGEELDPFGIKLWEDGREIELNSKDRSYNDRDLHYLLNKKGNHYEGLLYEGSFQEGWFLKENEERIKSMFNLPTVKVRDKNDLIVFVRLGDVAHIAPPYSYYQDAIETIKYRLLKEFEYFKTVEKSSYLKLNNLKMSKKFTIFNHYNKITTLLN